MTADYRKILDKIAIEVQPHFAAGKIADYIPALATAPPDCFGMAVTCVSGEEVFVGEADRRFSAQSISKVFALTLALQAIGPRLWDRLGREPSGDPFNSLVQLEHENGIPRNPFINAGALVVVDRLMDVCSDPKGAVLDFVREVTGCNDIEFDLEVARSEAAWGYRNRALANFSKVSAIWITMWMSFSTPISTIARCPCRAARSRVRSSIWPIAAFRPCPARR